jgi:hypothetical protein
LLISFSRFANSSYDMTRFGGENEWFMLAVICWIRCSSYINQLSVYVIATQGGVWVAEFF